MRRALAFVTLLGAGLLELVACSNDDEERRAESCNEMCGKLGRCRMLPSPLGIDEDNCTDRCKETGGLSDALIACSEKIEIPNGWCPADTECGSLVSCLQKAAPDAGLVARGSLRVVPVENDAGKAGVCTVTSCSPDLKTIRAEELCASWKSSVGTLFVADEASWLAETTTCVEALTAPPIFVGIDVRPLRAGLIVRSVSSDADAAVSETACLVFHSEITIGRAGDVCTGMRVSIDLEAKNAIACESGSLCADGEDNDLNGRVDCNDPECADECVVTEIPDAGTEEDSGTD
jgi:hypothetical protein